MATTAGNRSIPWDWYVDPAVARLEQETIFRRTWQYAGHTGEVAEPGSFTPARVGDVPVVLVRDQGGMLRAFVNVCRHRGYTLCEAPGKRETLQCAYHAWTYDLDGSLRNAPRADTEPGFDRDGLGLVPLAVDTWGPFVFVNPDPTRRSARRSPRRAAAHRGGGRRRRRRARLPSTGGGRVRRELEGLRRELPRVLPLRRRPPELLEGDRRRAGRYLLEEHPTFSSQYGPPKNGGGGIYDADGEVDRGQFHLALPRHDDQRDAGPRQPLDRARCSRSAPNAPIASSTTSSCPDADEQWIADLLELDNQVGAEDRALVERVQLGMRSGMLATGTCCPNRSA